MTRKEADPDVVHSATPLEDYEPGASREEILEALKRTAQPRKDTDASHRKKPPAPSSS